MRNRKEWKKRTFALLLAGAMLGTSFDLSAWTVYAAEEEVLGASGQTQATEQWSVYYSEAQVGIIPEEKLGAVAPAEGTHVKYIDRVSLSEVAKGIYHQLEDSRPRMDIASGQITDSPLVDPSRMEQMTITNGEAAVQGIYYTLSPVEWTIAQGNDVATACTDMQEEITTAYAAFLRDHPEVFWFSESVSVLITAQANGDGSVTCMAYLVLQKTDQSGNVSYDIRKEAYREIPKLERDIIARDVAVSTILSKVDQEVDSFEKVAFFNEWLTKNNCYNSYADRGTQSTAWECISALSVAATEGMASTDENGSSGTEESRFSFDVTSPVCEGYAKAFKVLCDQAGIPCVLVSGTAKSSDSAEAEPHMWNYVQIGNAWYAVDVTWNDPVPSNSSSESGETLISGLENTNYLLVGKNTLIGTMTFAVSHTESNQVMENGHAFTGGPVISDGNYTLPTFKSISIKNGNVECSDTETYNTTYGAANLSFTASAVGYDDKTVPDVSYDWTEDSQSVGTESSFTVPDDAPAGYHTYTLTVTKDDTSRSRSVKVYIAKAEPNVSSPEATKQASYGQTLADFTLPTANTSNGQTPGSWKWEDGDTAPVGAVGTAYHNAIFTPDDTANYKSVTVKVTFTISKANAQIEFRFGYNPSRAYNGEPLTNPTSSDLELYNVDYSEVKFEWYKKTEEMEGSEEFGVLLSEPPAEVGNYCLKAYVEETANHTAAIYRSIEVSITREDRTQITVDPNQYNNYKDKYYGEPGFTLTGISNNRDAPMTYSTYDTNVVKVDRDTGRVTIVGVGKAHINVEVAIKVGYYNGANAEIIINVSKQPITVKVKDVSMVSGDTCPDKFDLELQENSYLKSGDTIADIGDITYKVYQKESETETEVTAGDELSPGTYVIKGIVTNEKNYSVICQDGTLTVYDQQGTVSIDENAVKTKVFDNQPFPNLTYTTTNSGGTSQFSYRPYVEGMTDEEGTFTNGMPKDVGEYVIRLQISAANGYSEAVTYTHVTITHFDLSTAAEGKCLVSLPDTARTYDGASHTLGGITVSVKFGESNTYTIESNSYNITGNVWKDAGDYTADITVFGNCTGTVKAKYEVQKANGVNPPSATISTAYDKKNKTVGDVTLPADWSWKAEDASKQLVPGESHAVNATAIYKGDTKNYNTVSVTITMRSCQHPTTSQITDTAATCTTSGIAHTACDICGVTRTSNIVLQPLGHTGGTATCSAQAVCDRCHQPYGALNPSNHAHTSVREQKAATCTENGYTGDTYCDDCGTIIARGSTIPALGHTGGTATCSHQAVCDRCHQPYGELNPSNHESIRVTGQKAATCTENGYTGDTVCTECGQVLSRGESIPALGHSYTSSVTKEPTTEQEGVRTYTCSRCGDTYTEKMEKLPKEMGLTDGTWKLDDGKWWYAAADGSYPSNGWTLIEGEWYAFDDSGYMQTGWYQSGNSWYYLNNSGVMQTGWVGDGGTWYYMEDSGAMATGWTQDGNDWYYMDSSGAMCTGWQQIGGIWYYLKSSGVMATGWQQIGGTWYYFSDGGAMQTSWQKIDDTWYYFKPSGAMSVGWEKVGTTWYYFEGSGVMVTGWKYLDGSWYYFYDSGAMAADTTIDGYRLSSSGAMY